MKLKTSKVTRKDFLYKTVWEVCHWSSGVPLPFTHGESICRRLGQKGGVQLPHPGCGWGRIISWPEGCCALWHCCCVCVCVCVCVCSASGAAMFHLVNITQPAPPLYCHHHHNWQLAGYMLLQLLCFGPKGVRAGSEIKCKRDEMKHENHA